jgi:hypothetical protein
MIANKDLSSLFKKKNIAGYSKLAGIIKVLFDADIRKGESETFILKVKAKLSKGLKGWILGWGSRVRVLSPFSLNKRRNSKSDTSI